MSETKYMEKKTPFRLEAHRMHEQDFGLELSVPHSRYRFESAENKAALNDFNY